MTAVRIKSRVRGLLTFAIGLAVVLNEAVTSQGVTIATGLTILFGVALMGLPWRGSIRNEDRPAVGNASSSRLVTDLRPPPPRGPGAGSPGPSTDCARTTPWGLCRHDDVDTIPPGTALMDDGWLPRPNSPYLDAEAVCAHHDVDTVEVMSHQSERPVRIIATCADCGEIVPYGQARCEPACPPPVIVTKIEHLALVTPPEFLARAEACWPYSTCGHGVASQAVCQSCTIAGQP